MNLLCMCIQNIVAELCVTVIFLHIRLFFIAARSPGTGCIIVAGFLFPGYCFSITVENDRSLFVRTEYGNPVILQQLYGILPGMSVAVAVSAAYHCIGRGNLFQKSAAQVGTVVV